jgi:hypothetical protein
MRVFPHVILGKHLGVALAVKKKAYGLAFVLSLLFSAAAGLMLVEPAIANPIGNIFPREHYPRISINRDGSITPDTGYISRNGATYTLTANVTDHRVAIECSDVVFDGAGYTINLRNEMDPALYVGGSLGARNVTIKNVEVLSAETIQLYDWSYCQITNVKVDSYIYLAGSDHISISQCVGPIRLGWESEHNLVFRNNITLLSVFPYAESNVLYGNNFLRENYIPHLSADCFWDNGSVGNYWVDYNGTDADGDGIGDTPYVLNSGNVDYYPLMCPYDIENDAIAFPTPEPFPTALVIAVSGASIAIICIGLLVYFKKRKG